MNGKKPNLAFTSVVTAISASLCCITPLLAIISGTSGAASTFSWMEPLRPYLIATTLIVLAFAWYVELKPRKVMADDCGCEVKKPGFFRSTKFLGIITVFALVMLAFPYYSEVFYPDTELTELDSNAIISTVEFKIDGMTCQGCEEHINHAVSELAGISTLETSYSDSSTVISFNTRETSISDIEKAINSTGYSINHRTTQANQHGGQN